MLPEASVVVDGVETSVVLDEDVTDAVIVDPVVIDELILLPATVVVESVLASEEDVPFEPDIVVELVVAGVETTVVVVEYVTDWEMYIMKLYLM